MYRRASSPHKGEISGLIDRLRAEMKEASDALEFELAADLRDQIRSLEADLIRLG